MCVLPISRMTPNERLLQIADEIRAIPESFKNLDPSDQMEHGARLLREARQLGAFHGEEFVILRNRLDRIVADTPGLKERGELRSYSGIWYGEWIEAADFFCAELQIAAKREGRSAFSAWGDAPVCFATIADAVKAEVKRLAGGIGDHASSPPTAADRRNKWLYEECCKGTPYYTIRQKLKKKPATWERLDTDQGVKDAAKRYAEKNNLPLPLSRKSGRPKKRKPKH